MPFSPFGPSGSPTTTGPLSPPVRTATPAPPPSPLGPLFIPGTPPPPVVSAPKPALPPTATPTPIATSSEFLNVLVPAGVTKLWQHVSVGHNQAITQIKGRADGTIKSIRTPWSTFDDVGMNGLEWNSMMVIAARPGQGKTLVSSLICNEAHRLNPEQDFMILEMQFEMLAKNSAMRELSSHLGMSLKALNSAERDRHTGEVKKIASSDIARAEIYAQSQANRKHFIIEKALTAKGIGKAIEDFWKMYKLPFIVTLDHSMLVHKAADEKDKVEMLQNLGAVLTDVKRRMPIIVIILSQLNRTIEDATRQEKPGSHGNYPNEADIFGGDALLQHADIVCCMNRPAKYNLAIYGPDRFKVTHANLLAFHFLKVRSGNPRISFFMGEFEKMSIREVAPPPTAPSTRGSI